MLVNVSRFNAVQAQVRELIESHISDMQFAIESWSMANWKKSDSLQQLKRVWDEEYEGTVDLDWDSIRPFLKDSISSIKTLLVNMKGSGINYESAPSTGLHVIGVGGLALARGLTLEGLLVSYVLRNVGAADTLLQMGRWFGYRPGFESICRIHGGGHILLHLTVVAGITHIGRKTEVVVHPAAVKAHAPEVEAVVRAVEIAVGFGVPGTNVERRTKAEHGKLNFFPIRSCCGQKFPFRSTKWQMQP